MKKDWNYVAAIEKAIAEKYGKDTIQDFKSGWDEIKEKEYLEQLKEANKKENTRRYIEENNEDNIRIRKKKKTKTSERSCPVCKTYSFSMKDDLYMNRFNCCFRCYVDFVEGREEAWKEGQRPDQERIETALRRRE